MSVEVWDQASGQNHVLQVENQVFNLALSQQEAHPPCPQLCQLTDGFQNCELQHNCKLVTVVAPSCE